MYRSTALIAALAISSVLLGGHARAVDLTDSEPSANDVRDALLGNSGGMERDLSMGAMEKRASLAIPFAVNSANLAPSAQRLVDALAMAIMDPALGNARIRIEGHTDASGSFNQNMQLSAQRAATVIGALAQRGVPVARLSGVGRGPSQPLPNLSPLSPRNRRVDAVVVSQ